MSQVRLDARDQQSRPLVRLVQLEWVTMNASLFGAHVAAELKETLLFTLSIKVRFVLVSAEELGLFLGS